MNTPRWAMDMYNMLKRVPPMSRDDRQMIERQIDEQERKAAVNAKIRRRLEKVA